MKIGVVLPIAEDEGAGSAPTFDAIRTFATLAEAAGFDSVWVYDHLLFRHGHETSGIHESWTILAAIAAVTERVELGTLVMGAEFRNPALMAKMAATLDAVSGGRLILGLGSGWHDPEYTAFGYPVDHKVGRFADSLAIVSELIRTGRSDHRGRFHSVDDAELAPRARSDIPILVASKRPRMLELTARYADAWNQAWFGLPNERLASLREDLVRACEAVDRDPATLSITVGVNVLDREALAGRGSGSDEPRLPALEGSAVEIAAALDAYAATGVDHLIGALQPRTPATLATFAQAMAIHRGA